MRQRPGRPQPLRFRAIGPARPAPKALAAVFCVLVVAALSLPVLADPFAELPLRHWSFDALVELVPSGLVNEATVAAYRARQGVMRFEAALLVAGAVRTLEAAHPGEVVDLDQLGALPRGGSSGQRQGRGQGSRLDAGAVDALRRLVNEFAPELEVLEIQVTGTALPAAPLSLPTSAQGPFVDLETLAELSEQGEPLPDAVRSVAGPGVLPPGKTPSVLSGPVARSGQVAGSAKPVIPNPGDSRANPTGSAATVVSAGTGLSAPAGLSPAASAPGVTGVDRSADKATTESVAAAGSMPGVIAFPEGTLPGGPGVVPAGLPEIALPQGALTRPGASGLFPGRVDAERQPTYESAVAARPVLALDAAVQTGETRLPWPVRKLSVSPTVRVSSTVAQPGTAREGAGAVEVQAAVTVSGVEVGASVKKVQGVAPRVDPALASNLRVGLVPATQGYGVNVRLGQVAVSTGVDQVRKDADRLETRRSMEVGYALGSSTVLRAGYRLVDLDTVSGEKPGESAPGSRSRTDATLGVDVNLSRIATVSAGLTLEGMQSFAPGGAIEGQRATAGVELRLPWNTFLTAGYEFYNPAAESVEVRPQSAATVGVGYNFASSATLLVGYRLIDFDAAEPSEEIRLQQNLMAGISLNF